MNQATPEPQPKESHDLVIIGGGPAGISAAMYAARDRLDVLIVERGLTGGLINESDKVDNYPGFPDGVSGLELTAQMWAQAEKFGAKLLAAEVSGVRVFGKHDIRLQTADGEIGAKALIIAGGSEREKLAAPGEKEFIGKGVAYCATCDAPFYREKTVAVVGGGNAALYEALHLAKFAQKVHVIHRRDALRATPVVQERVQKEPKISLVLNSIVEEVGGKDFVEKIKIKNVATGEISELPLDGVFVAIGLKPNTGYLQGVVALDERGMIMVDEMMQTSVPGIFAAGDIRHNSIRQTIAAAGDGAVAAVSAKKWIEEG
jgi:thioredoxin reductase (NADPH)